MNWNYRSWMLMGVVLLLGCNGGREEAPTHPVRGTVTLDGRPLPEGEIYFITTSSGEIDILPIKDGEFEGEAKAGNRRVEVHAYRIERPPAPPDMPGLELEPQRVEILPPHCHRDSTLTAEITPDGPNEFNYELTSE